MKPFQLSTGDGLFWLGAFALAAVPLFFAEYVAFGFVLAWATAAFFFFRR